MKIAVGNSRMDRKWKNKDISWEDFCSRVKTTQRTTETVQEYRKLKKGQQDDIKDVGGFVGGHLKEGRRKKGNVLCRSLLTLDMDYGRPDIWEQISMLFDFKCCVYSTHKHTPENPRLRLIVPLAREISEEEYAAVGRMVAKEIGIDLFDDTTYEAHRLMYWPSTSSNGEFVYEEQDGALLDPDVYLSKYENWRDTTTWPVSSRQSEVINRSLKEQADPLLKEGVVGTFCRAYSVREAIDKFLVAVYAPSAMEGRYDYIPADSSAGVIIYDDKFAYSHHATDPASGLLLNIGGQEHELILTTKATKEIARRYGGLENLGEKLLKSENFEMALDEIIWLITLLANQSILIHNLRNKEATKEVLTEDEVELLTTPLELATYKSAITEAMFKGTKRNIESEDNSKNTEAE